MEKLLGGLPVRQFVLSMPFELRFQMARDSKLMSVGLAIVNKSITHLYRNKAKTELGMTGALKTGAVTFIQRYGSSLNLNIHFHILVVEGVWSDGDAKELPASTNANQNSKHLRHRPMTTSTTSNISLATLKTASSGGLLRRATQNPQAATISNLSTSKKVSSPTAQSSTNFKRPPSSRALQPAPMRLAQRLKNLPLDRELSVNERNFYGAAAVYFRHNPNPDPEIGEALNHSAKARDFILKTDSSEALKGIAKMAQKEATCPAVAEFAQVIGKKRKR